jgi:hypothetical protein
MNRCQYQFSDESVTIVGEKVKSECSWSVFNKAYEIPSAFLLMYDKKFIYIIPKGCFYEPEMIERMHSLLSEKIQKFKKYF